MFTVIVMIKVVFLDIATMKIITTVVVVIMVTIVILIDVVGISMLSTF